MDAKISVLLSIKKLQDLLLLDEARTNNPWLRIQVQTAIDNLQSFKQILKDAEDHEASSGDSLDDQRTAQLLQAVYSVEMAADTLFIRRRELQEIRNSSEHGCKPFKSFKSFRRQVVFTKKMKKFNDEVRRLVGMLGDASGGQQSQHQGRTSGFCLEEETHHVIGLEQQINELLIQLIAKQDQDTQVITVVGEGGSGKTTLATAVYNRVDVKRHFTHRAWVRINPSAYKSRDVLVDILKQFDQDQSVVLTAFSDETLIQWLTKLLKRTRFLIVLEDVETPQVWESLQAALSSSSSQGGRIVVTTRNANGLQTSDSVIELRRLNEEESWALFLNKVRLSEDELNNSDLISFKEQIVSICGGLPSAIVLLGGLLSTKGKSPKEWSRILTMLVNKDIMALSYQNLPSRVKPCFVYMAIFPRGFDIPVRRLIHLWCAEGFMTPPDGEEIDPESTAELCFEELVIRNMIQVKWKLDGSPKTCCMPRVLFDVFSPKAEAVGFFNTQLHSSPEESNFAVRRQAAYLGIKNSPSSSFLDFQNLRSYIAFDTRTRGTPAREIGMFLNKIINNKGYGFLYALDLEGVYKPKLSQVVGKLFCLHYLGLRSTFLDSLPTGVESLSCLETLDLRHTNIKEIHISEAKNLRYLYLPPDYSVAYFYQFNLHTLWGLQIRFSNDNVSFRHMTRLRKLQVTCLSGSIGFDGIAAGVSQLINLQTLKLISVPKRSDEYISERLMTMHQKLQDLYLLGRLVQKSVIDIGLPPNLRKLTLSLSQLEEDPMPVLGQLHHLNILRLLADSYVGQQITCHSTGFPKLHVLKLCKLRVREWTVEEGAMPCLKQLEIKDCNNLEPPQGLLQKLTTLRELALTNMSREFGAAVQQSFQCRDVYIINKTYPSSSLQE
ncbi:hypothetical protein ACOSP7_019942 [Xanthoceras sorbifolium]